MTDFSLYPNFTEDEFRCSCGCGKANMSPQFMRRLQTLRDGLQKPIVINSGYRCPNHHIEAAKRVPGPHTTGCAADIAVYGGRALDVVGIAYRLGFTGIGEKQHGPHKKRFIHLDDLAHEDERPRPWKWSYP